jgi:hypothetical protein
MPALAEAVVVRQWIFGQLAGQWDGQMLVAAGDVDATVCSAQTAL